MNEEQIKKYNELLKKHEILTKRYADLEKLEEKLNSDKTMSGEKRLENLNKLAQEYEKVANLMQEITKEAEQLKDSI